MSANIANERVARIHYVAGAEARGDGRGAFGPPGAEGPAYPAA